MPRPSLPDHKRKVRYTLALRPRTLARLRERAEREGVPASALAASLLAQALRQTPAPE